jgi:hypothetical protein
MKSLFKLHADCGKQGKLNGLFIAQKSHVEKLIESKLEVYFGEVLGKHSEVFGAMDENDIEFITSDANVIEIIEKHDLCNGFNPFEQSVVNFDYESIGIAEENEDGDATTVKEIIEKMLS